VLHVGLDGRGYDVKGGGWGGRGSRAWGRRRTGGLALRDPVLTMRGCFDGLPTRRALQHEVDAARTYAAAHGLQQAEAAEAGTESDGDGAVAAAEAALAPRTPDAFGDRCARVSSDGSSNSGSDVESP